MPAVASPDDACLGSPRTDGSDAGLRPPFRELAVFLSSSDGEAARACLDENMDGCGGGSASPDDPARGWGTGGGSERSNVATD